MASLPAMTSLFAGLSTDRLCSRNAILFHRGAKAFAIFQVLSGRVRLLRNTVDGEVTTLFVARPGDFFAEASLFTEVYHCDAVADVDCSIAVYPRQAILTRLSSEPAIAMQFAQIQAQQIQALRGQLEMRNIRSAKQRVWQYLLLQKQTSSGKIFLDRPLKDMASDIGLSHEAFYRALSALKKEGRITRTGDMIQIISVSADG